MKIALTYEYEDLMVSVAQEHRNRDRLQQEISSINKIYIYCRNLCQKCTIDHKVY